MWFKSYWFLLLDFFFPVYTYSNWKHNCIKTSLILHRPLAASWMPTGGQCYISAAAISSETSAHSLFFCFQLFDLMSYHFPRHQICLNYLFLGKWGITYHGHNLRSLQRDCLLLVIDFISDSAECQRTGQCTRDNIWYFDLSFLYIFYLGNRQRNVLKSTNMHGNTICKAKTVFVRVNI